MNAQLPVATTPQQVIVWPNEADRLMLLCRELAQARTIPQWCQKSPADLFFAVQAFLRRGLDPFMALPHVSMIQNKLFFDGMLCAAVMHNSRKLATNLTYDYSGEGDDRTVTARARLVNETAEREARVRLGDVKTKNDNWRTIPDQMLSYNAARVWGRRYVPEVLLGINWKDEEDDMVDVTPPVKTHEPAAVTIPQAARAMSDAQLDTAIDKANADTVSDQQTPFEIGRNDDTAETWSQWAQLLMAYVRAAPSAELINEWTTANADHLAALQKYDVTKYRRLIEMIDHQIAARDETG